MSHPIVDRLEMAAARRHRALRADLEYAPLFPGDHLERERRRVERVLAGGGWALATPRGLALFRPLPFDSDHFGVRCGDLHRVYLAPRAALDEAVALVDAAVQRARRQGVQLLSARPRAEQQAVVQRLLHHGFLLVDTSVELGRRGRPRRRRPPARVAVRDPAPADLPGLRRVARTFVDNRFHRDPRIPSSRAAALYARWAEQAAAGQFGQLKLVESEGEVAGLCTYVPPASNELRVGTVGLVVIHPRFRGQGLFRPLVSAAAAASRGRQATVTSTQVTNTAALRAFAGLGLLPFAARQILHGWL